MNVFFVGGILVILSFVGWLVAEVRGSMLVRISVGMLMFLIWGGGTVAACTMISVTENIRLSGEWSTMIDKMLASLVKISDEEGKDLLDAAVRRLSTELRPNNKTSATLHGEMAQSIIDKAAHPEHTPAQ